MRSFSTYLNVYRNNKLRTVESEINLEIIPPKVPSSCRDNADVASFFEGKNVYNEQINTYSRYTYKATITTKKTHTEQELEKAIKKGLEELGYSYIDFSVKSLPKAKPNKLSNNYRDFEISIVVI